MKIVIILTSHEKLGDTGRKTGCWLESLAIPYALFKDAGAAITFASPQGGPVPVDPKSESIIASNSTIRRFQKDPEAVSDLSHSHSLDTLKAEDFDMVLLPGGHGPLWDFPDNDPLRQLLGDFIVQDKPIGLISHGVSALLSLHNSLGGSFIKGRNLTAFSNSEEQVAGLPAIVPFSLESKLIGLGAFYSKGPDFTSHVVTDGNIITGQNPASSMEVSRRMLFLFKETQKKVLPVLY
ncbi:MAG TPA: type 1 glutamine amidotransferase domain-containing protein [Puia sp.]